MVVVVSVVVVAEKRCSHEVWSPVMEEVEVVETQRCPEVLPPAREVVVVEVGTWEGGYSEAEPLVRKLSSVVVEVEVEVWEYGDSPYPQHHLLLLLLNPSLYRDGCWRPLHSVCPCERRGWCG